MATLVLTAVGTAVGGPFGGALGALAGQALDARLLGRKGRDGPRLTDLAVQTSSYGTPIPRLYGTMRVAGTVIWSTDLIEHASRTGGGKGGGGGTNYSYTESFAVLLSARRVRAVRRIWADGKLLRGAAGDLKIPVTFRLHAGSEAQAPDPLIASAEGIGQAPACRGQAYAVFEDLALGDFGNRIPSLTFEVEADEGAVDCGTILDDVTGGMVHGATGSALLGYSAYGDTLRGIVDSLCVASGAWIAVDAAGLALHSGDGAAMVVADAGAGSGGRGARAVAPADVAPRSLVVQYHDPARDYQVGVQTARRAGGGGRERQVAIPAAIPAPEAKRIAAAVLARSDRERERRTVSLDWRSAALAPGNRVRISGEAGAWRIVSASLDAMVLTLELAPIARAPVERPATAGRVVPAPDRVVGPTIVHAVELPSIGDTVLAAPRITILASGAGAGWRSAMLSLSMDGGSSWTALGPSRGRATIGTLTSPLPAAPSTLIDRANALEVELAGPDMDLSDADAAALDAGANMAIVGDELLQFGSAERIGEARWRLTQLWRGRRGTEWASGAAEAGARFAMLDPGAGVTVDLSAGAIGSEVRVMALGVGDVDEAATATATIDGRSVAPPSPVHLHVAADASGAAVLRWTRRSRAGWHWVDRVDAALGEEVERYVVSAPDGGELVTVSTSDVRCAALFGHDPRAVAVRQVGTMARSRQATVRDEVVEGIGRWWN